MMYPYMNWWIEKVRSRVADMSGMGGYTGPDFFQSTS